MSQQLNLLGKEKRTVSPVLVTLVVWSLTVLGVFAIWGVNQFRLSAAKEAESIAGKELADARALIKKREDTEAALAAEIQSLRPAADAAQQFLQQAEALGSPRGYTPHFLRLANAAEDGLWLTGIEIKNSGKGVRVEGQALSNDAILRYGQAIQASFAEQGVGFSAIEMTSQKVGAPGSALPVMNSTRFVMGQQ